MLIGVSGPHGTVGTMTLLAVRGGHLCGKRPRMTGMTGATRRPAADRTHASCVEIKRKAIGRAHGALLRSRDSLLTKLNGFL